MTAIHVRADEGRRYPMTDGDHIAKAAVHDSGGSFEVFEVVAPRAPMAPPHVSPWTAVLYLLDGHVAAYVDDARFDVEPGGLVVFPAGAPCTFEVLGDSARMLGITTGDGAGRFFADFSASVPTNAPVEQAMAAILAVTSRHGVSVAHP